MVNVAILGKRYPETPAYLVGREKIREFARAVKSESQIHFDEAEALKAGFLGVVAPATFAVVIQDFTLQQLLNDEDAAVDFSMVVHGDQKFEYSRPIIAGDELTATLEITQVKQLAGNSMVTASSEIVDRDGKHVVTAISTLVVRGSES